MNTVSRLTALIILLCMSTSVLIAGPEQEKSKTISKNYNVSKTTTLNIENSFGKIHINNWDKSEFDIKVEIVAKSGNEDKAQKILDNIEIEISESSSEISFLTKLNNIKTKNNDGFEVNYTVNMPKDNPISLKNSFGDIYIDSRFGETEIDLAYGSMKARDFNQPADIKISFGAADIGEMKEGDLEIKYSSAEILSLGVIDLESGFSDVEIESIDQMDVVSKYGSLEIGTINEIEADVQFSKFSIEQLNGFLDLEASYVSGLDIDMVSKDFQFLYVDAKFSTADIRFEEGTSADFEGEFEFCDLRVSDIPMDYSVKIKDDNESEYKARMGNGQPDGKRVRLYSSYGNMSISER